MFYFMKEHDKVDIGKWLYELLKKIVAKFTSKLRSKISSKELLSTRPCFEKTSEY